MEDIDTPKAFISYSRTEADHIKWVVELAEELVENGVDVVLDEWHLQEGQDLYAFMEQAVTDPEMDKVIVVSDEEYARKADERKGGVGTETQIISQDLYDEVDPEDPQQKFVAVVTEKDEEGNAYLPAYLGSRIYIDMSTEDLRMDNFEQLLRWLFDEPVSEEPEKGEPPDYLFRDEGPDLGTRSRARRAKKVLRDGDSAAIGALHEYFETFADNLERFAFDSEENRPPPEEIVERIENFLPFRDEAVDVFVTLAKYWPGEEGGQVLHAFFERLLPCLVTPHSQDRSADHFSFIVRELFLYAISALLKYRRYETINFLTEQSYYSGELSPTVIEGAMSFTAFQRGMESIKDHPDHNAAGLLQSRANRQDLSHADLMQADLVLYLRTEADKYRGRGGNLLYRWYPTSLRFARGRTQPFELFARATRRTSEGLERVLALSDWNEFTSLMQEIEEESGFPEPGRWPINVPRLVGIEQ